VTATTRSGVEVERGLRLVALLEAGKGVLALLGAAGVLRLVHHDVREVLERLLLHLRLNPAAGEPAVLLRLAAHATDVRLQLLAAGVSVYAGMRLTEAWGLWHERRWAAWIGVLTAAAYVPVEVLEVVRRPSVLAALALTVNAVVLFWLARGLRQGRRRSEAPPPAAP
jgi:uncharacterized membrane protein (DUF2068 family)